jgi:hypothetical protein
MEESKEKLKYTMCSGKSCCPILTELEDGTFTITDDFNGKVLLTKEELTLLKTFLSKNLD